MIPADTNLVDFVVLIEMNNVDLQESLDGSPVMKLVPGDDQVKVLSILHLGPD